MRAITEIDAWVIFKKLRRCYKLPEKNLNGV